MNDENHIGVRLAKKAYVNGNIDLETLERALEDRLVGSSFSHDARIDGHIPPNCRGEGHTPHSY